MAEKTIATYLIFNTKNNRIYIGSSVDVYKRFKSHKSHLRHGKHANKYLQNDWNKCGEDVFLFVILNISKTSMHVLQEEQVLIDMFWDKTDKCYNINRFVTTPPSHKKSRLGKNNPNYGKKNTQTAILQRVASYVKTCAIRRAARCL
jgi:group I intron endonuclease